VPDSLSVQDDTACSYSHADVDLIRDTKSAQSYFSKQVSFSDNIGIPILAGLEFSGSEDIQKLNQSTREGNLTLAYMSASCNLYRAQRSSFSELNFTTNFLTGTTVV
jgi:hypothetical protein